MELKCVQRWTRVDDGVRRGRDRIKKALVPEVRDESRLTAQGQQLLPWYHPCCHIYSLWPLSVVLCVVTNHSILLAPDDGPRAFFGGPLRGRFTVAGLVGSHQTRFAVSLCRGY